MLDTQLLDFTEIIEEALKPLTPWEAKAKYGLEFPFKLKKIAKGTKVAVTQVGDIVEFIRPYGDGEKNKYINGEKQNVRIGFDLLCSFSGEDVGAMGDSKIWNLPR